MKTDEIKEKLTDWSKKMTSEYLGLRIRFEYSESRRVFLVSLYPDEIAYKENFSNTVMSFEDEMEDLYGDDAPLFCDNERLFRLSSEAETIVAVQELMPAAQWHFSVENTFTETLDYNLAA